MHGIWYHSNGEKMLRVIAGDSSIPTFEPIVHYVPMWFQKKIIFFKHIET
ncbi:MAG: hypothetical protein RL264_2521 [Bacteroidota bacterium]|jgi:hypothetical protein